MKIYSVYDPEFKAYGQIVTGMDESVQDILTALATTPCPDGVDYVPTDPVLQELPAAIEVSLHCFGGMPAQLGWCNGHNTKLNCLEYHRDSEFNLGTEDFILLLARQEEIENGLLDTAKVKAFKVPAGVMVEVFATTLHYAPCHADSAKGFRVLVALPWLTNTDRPVMTNKTPEDEILTARNKWLLAHPESSEAKNGAKVGLTGININLEGYKMKTAFHLDAGRKFFGKPALKTIIDTLSETGIEFFQLYLTDNQGFRFALNDMMMTTPYGTYDLSEVPGDGYCEGPKGPCGSNKFHTEADMDEILAYGKEKGVNIIPCINIPGHMGCILEKFPHLRYRNSKSSVNMMDPEGMAFALGLLEKYADYFASRGCTHMSFGADEFANDIHPGYPDLIEMGYERIYHDGDMKYFVELFNASAKIICDRNMIPLAFHDGVYYRNDKKYGEMDTRVWLCYWSNGWDTYVTATADFLAEQGFPMINSAGRIYCGMGCRDWSERAERAGSFDPYVFEKDVRVENPEGAMLCFWSDCAFLDGQDDGVTAAANVAPVLRAFGENMKKYE